MWSQAKELKEKLNNCYSRELCYPKIADKWSKK